MNAKKILALLVLIAAIVSLFVSCKPKEEAKHEHEYAAWSIETQPTEQNPGVATRKCECGETEKADIPALTNAEVWTKETTPATHAAAGLVVYTSVYGSVEIALEIIPHEWTYELTTEPTEAAAGQAKKSCECGVSETVSVPALTDASVWSAEITVAPSHLAEGKKVYTSALYGSVEVVLDKTADHAYGAWTVVTQATEEAAGVAERECECGAKETGVIPVLTDASVWASEVIIDPTHTEEGEKVYISELYGTVTVVLSKLTDHSYGDEWTIVTNPTVNAEGKASHTCICGYTETVNIPAFTATAFSS